MIKAMVLVTFRFPLGLIKKTRNKMKIPQVFDTSESEAVSIK